MHPLPLFALGGLVAQLKFTSAASGTRKIVPLLPFTVALGEYAKCVGTMHPAAGSSCPRPSLNAQHAAPAPALPIVTKAADPDTLRAHAVRCLEYLQNLILL